MFTRKLNELQINNVLQHINTQNLVSLSVYKNKKGVHMIAYDVGSANGLDASKSPKSHKTVELMRLLREIRKQVCNNTYESIRLDYHCKGQLTYQLELKEQG